MRATTTIVAALESGAREVIPVREVEMALRMRESSHEGQMLLGGERGSVRIDGFDLANSPEEYTPSRIGGATVVLTTTNGTLAVDMVRSARRLLCGSLRNASAVARRIINDDCDEILMVCAGTHGRLALEDVIGAGAVIEIVAMERRETRLSDGARVAVDAWRAAREDIEAVVRESDHGRTLLSLGFEDDIKYCTSLNRSDIVPQLSGSGFIDARQTSDFR